MKLLLMSTGRRVSLLQRLRDSAKRMKVDLHIVGTELYPWTPSLHFCDGYHIVAPTFSSEHEYQLAKLIDDEKIDAVLPGNDFDLRFLNQVREKAPWKDIRILDAGIHQEIFLSKTRSAKFFEEIGLKVPQIFKNPSEVITKSILKEDEGYGSINQFIVKNSSETNLNWSQLKNPFLQEFIDGVEYTIDVFSADDFQTINCCPRIRSKVRAGVSDVGRVHLNSDLMGLLNQKLPYFKLRGPWNIQCIYDQKEYYFLEVNPRFSGGVPLSIAAGCDLSQNLLEWYFDKPLTRFGSVKDGMVMMKYEQELFIEC